MVLPVASSGEGGGRGGWSYLWHLVVRGGRGRMVLPVVSSGEGREWEDGSTGLWYLVVRGGRGRMVLLVVSW